MYLGFEDCVGLCDLTEEEVLAIAEHEHIPAMAAVQLADYLVHTPGGEQRIKAHDPRRHCRRRPRARSRVSRCP